MNTLRCLVGCSIGDFAALAYLSSVHPDLSTPTVVALSMTAGISTSVALETAVLRVQESMSWRRSLSTALNMSFISMLAMEASENAVELYLTGGCPDPSTPMFWTAMAPSLLAGFLVPLPYNYFMLRKYGRSCH